MLNLKRVRLANSMTQKETAEYFGCKQSFISQIENSNRKLPDEYINKLISDPQITIPEELELSKSFTPKEVIKHNPYPKTETDQGVPYYDIDITATISEGFTDVIEIPEFYVNFKPFNDCTAYLPIWGDSMHPLFSNGEIIAIKELKNPEIILWGEAYLIITNEEANNMKTIKLLFPHTEDDKIILRAANPNFRGDTIIPKKSIINLYMIKGKITRSQL